MGSLPAFDESGDLPVGVHQATLQEVIQRFGRASARREAIAARLQRIYALASDAVEHWQVKRDGTQRGIVEVIAG